HPCWQTSTRFVVWLRSRSPSEAGKQGSRRQKRRAAHAWACSRPHARMYRSRSRPLSSNDLILLTSAEAISTRRSEYFPSAGSISPRRSAYFFRPSQHDRFAWSRLFFERLNTASQGRRRGVVSRG